MNQITVYTIPDSARIPSDGGHDGCRTMGYVPAGHYLEHPSMSARGGKLCIVPCDDPGGLSWRWVERYRVASFARSWGPSDHHGPVLGKCFLGLNFTERDMDVVLQALMQFNLPDPAKVVAEICRQWLARDVALKHDPLLVEA